MPSNPAEAVSTKLQNSNIFTIAKRNVEGQDMLYQSLKLTNGIWVLAELRIQPGSPSFTVRMPEPAPALQPPHPIQDSLLPPPPSEARDWLLWGCPTNPSVMTNSVPERDLSRNFQLNPTRVTHVRQWGLPNWLVASRGTGPGTHCHVSTYISGWQSFIPSSPCFLALS